MVFTGYYDLNLKTWITLPNPSLLETYDERFAAVREGGRVRKRREREEREEFEGMGKRGEGERGSELYFRLSPAPWTTILSS